MKPKLFIGSSRESLDIAYALQENLEFDVDCTVWNQGIFEPTAYTLESLEVGLDEFDFGAFIFTGDDIIKIRGNEKLVTRDNIIFELGLYIGKLGKDRCFIIVPSKDDFLHMPTDLLGITTLEFNSTRDDANLQAALGPTANKIRRVIQKLGFYSNKNIKKLHDKLNPLPIERGIREVIEKIEGIYDNHQKKFLSGYDQLDNIIHGFSNGLLYLLAGVPSIGTTSFLLNIILNLTANDVIRGCIFSLDLSNEQLIQKLLSIQSSVPYGQLETGTFGENDIAKISHAIHPLAQKGLSFISSMELELEEILQSIRKLKDKQDISFVAIDNIERIGVVDNKKEINKKEVIIEKLRSIAKELNLFIICTTTIDINKIINLEKIPYLEYLDPIITKNTDVILLLHRPEFWGITYDKQGNTTSNVAMINIAKNKFGVTGFIKLILSPTVMKFCNAISI